MYRLLYPKTSFRVLQAKLRLKDKTLLRRNLQCPGIFELAQITFSPRLSLDAPPNFVWRLRHYLKSFWISNASRHDPAPISHWKSVSLYWLFDRFKALGRKMSAEFGLNSVFYQRWMHNCPSRRWRHNTKDGVLLPLRRISVPLIWLSEWLKVVMEIGFIPMLK